MMVLLQILPIALMLLIAFSFLILRNKKIAVKPKKPRRKMVREIFIGYTAVLILSMAAYYVLPVSGEEVSQVSDPQRVSQDEGWSIHEKATQNRFDEIDPAYLIEQKEFEYSKLTLVMPDNLSERGDPEIIVTVDGALDDQILMDVYKTPFTLNGVDITDEVVRPDVTIKSNMVSISNVYGQNDLHYIQFNPSFVTEQFFNDEQRNRYGGFGYSYGVQVVHLYVPEDVTIIGEVQQFRAQ
ncbi:hypothetical protein [Jeotgalibacillus sp. JSM ZJ347]|uniref:hypothetical protein n=1 Tax=Jeotgalibacillus sp. JSM ZJ347 TaxID=3342117 RepID=UPI0035A91DDF